MAYLLTYGGYMSEEKIKELCPTAKLFMKCGIINYFLEFHTFFEMAIGNTGAG